MARIQITQNTINKPNHYLKKPKNVIIKVSNFSLYRYELFTENVYT